jgi:hypothetical protein
MIKTYIRKRRHIRFVHSRLYDLKYDMLNQSLKMTSIDNSVDLYKNFEDIRIKAELFKKYQRRLKLLQF